MSLQHRLERLSGFGNGRLLRLAPASDGHIDSVKIGNSLDAAAPPFGLHSSSHSRGAETEVSGSMFARAVRLGLVTLAAAAAFGAASQTSAAQDVAKPAAATAPAGDAAQVEKGRALFDNYGCASCHSLADAGATGHVGPSLDGNASLSQAFVVDRVTHGQGGMPAFGEQLTPEEINALATYVNQVAQK